ncbi:MAG TPA: ABC-F family ATP-binding cassette domain-containing protein [Anaerolineae bacterium]|nr:ABC-F family ATP-binding cassette domain-containing protein [Anaerolineae bacterium]HXK41599.1 ABC-F family ATP-binding cassette domain-containing protein [Anaerolineae bacterium]
MALLTASNLSKFFGAEQILADVSFEVHPGDRIALVGLNGCGKSTLLEIVAGRLEPDAGSVHRARHLRLGYLPQHPDFDGAGTLWEALETVFEGLLEQAQELRALEQRMASGDETALERYGAVLEAFDAAGGFTYEARIGQVLGGLGFAREEFETPIAHLSGGEKTRALLARLLLEEPDFLLLDEPTNHLDIEGIEWLEEQLRTWKGALIIVAHDREFLDAVATRVWELAFTRLETYRGNYTAYTEQRAARRQQQQAAYEAQQEHIARTEEYIHRYMAGQRSTQAKGRLRRLEREERYERPQEAQRIRLDLHTGLRSGNLVLGLYDLQAGYEPGAPLVTVAEAEIHRGERVALVGPNGAGKTTLLRTILQTLPPLGGRVRIGAAVCMGYFAQVQADLDPRLTVLETLGKAGMDLLSEGRAFLARYGFRGDEVFKEIGVLSGGERARVALALLALQRANFLLLDEPTNHLDLPSQETLQEVIAHFPGTVLLVSHDRYLIRQLATHVWAIADGAVHIFEGYQAYADWHQQRREGAPAARQLEERARAEREAARQAQREQQRAQARQQQRLEALEAVIHERELHLRQLTHALEVAGRAQDVTRVAKLGAEYRQVEAELNTLLEEWVVVAGAVAE